MKEGIFSLIALIVAFLMSSCQPQEDFSLVGPEDQMDSIEIITVYNWSGIPYGGPKYDPEDPNSYEIQWSIDPEQHDEFLKELYKVPCYRYTNDPWESFAKNTIRVTYSDGSYEYIGEATVYYETATGDWSYPKCYFDREKFREFVSGTKDMGKTGDGSLSSETPSNPEP